MKRLTFVVLFVFTFALLLNACGPSGSPAASTPAGAQPAASPTSGLAQAVTPGAAVPTNTPLPTRAPRQAPAGATRVEFWHALGGANGDAVEEMGKRRLTDPTQSQRCDGDTQLGAGDVAVEMLKRRLDATRTAIAVGDHLVQFAAPGRN